MITFDLNKLDLNRRPDFVLNNSTKNRVARMALLILSLHPTTSRCASLAVGVYALYNASSNNSAEYRHLITVIISAVLGFSAPKTQLFFSTAIFLIELIKEENKGVESLIRLINQVVYVLSVVDGSMMWKVHSVGMQTMGEIFRCWQQNDPSMEPIERIMIAALALLRYLWVSFLEDPLEEPKIYYKSSDTPPSSGYLNSNFVESNLVIRSLTRMEAMVRDLMPNDDTSTTAS